MPVVALVVLVVIAGCGATYFVASRAKSTPEPQRRRAFGRRSRAARRSRRTEIVDTDTVWQSSDWTGQNSVLLPTGISDDLRADDDGCRVEADSSSDFDVERDDSCSSDPSDSSDSSSDSSDSGSSD